MCKEESESLAGLRSPCSTGKDCRWYLGSVGLASWEIRGSAELRKTLKLAEAKNGRVGGKQNFWLFNKMKKKPCSETRLAVTMKKQVSSFSHNMIENRIENIE